MPKYNVKAVLRGLTQTVKDYANIRAEKSKIMGDMLANELQAKQNWFYRQKELDYQGPYQKQLEEQRKKQQTGEVQSGQGRILAGQGGYYEQAPQAKTATEMLSDDQKMKIQRLKILSEKQQGLQKAGKKLSKQEDLDLQLLNKEFFGIKPPAATEIETKDKFDKLKVEAAKEGYDINVDPNDPIEEQYQNAVSLYARAKMIESKKSFAWQAKRDTLKVDYEAGDITLDEYKKGQGILIDQYKKAFRDASRKAWKVNTPKTWNQLKGKFPDMIEDISNMEFEKVIINESNLKNITEITTKKAREARDKAIEWLQGNNAPNTEANINAVIEKFGW